MEDASIQQVRDIALLNREKIFRKIRLFKLSRELNLTDDTIVAFLQEHGYADALTGKGLNAAITDEEAYLHLREAYAADQKTASRVRDLRAARQGQARRR